MKNIPETLGAHRQIDGKYVFDGIEHENATDLLCSLLGFCGCASPEDAIMWVLEGMELLATPWRNSSELPWQAWYESYRKNVDAHFRNPGAEMFFWYWCNQNAFTEHGGSVPGWLRPEGESMLALLREWKTMESESTK